MSNIEFKNAAPSTKPVEIDKCDFCFQPVEIKLVFLPDGPQFEIEGHEECKVKHKAQQDKLSKPQ